MVYSNTWNANFEALPTDTEDIGDGANRIREKVLAVRERMQKDHYWDLTGNDADHGEHNQVTLRVSANAPANQANKGIVYSFLAANKIELFYKNSANQVVQLTANGLINISQFPTGTKLPFYQDAAPAGWTIDETLNDKLLFVTKGSNAGGQVGGGPHASGNWVISDLTHAHVHPGASHTHPVPASNNVWGGGNAGNYGGIELASSNNAAFTAVINANTLVNSNGNTGAANDANITSGGTWRPQAYCVIIATKD